MASIQQRKTNDGKYRYRVLIRLSGYPPQTATFDRKTDAKKWAQATESKIREGRYFVSNEAQKHTLAELTKRYITNELPKKPGSAASQKTQLKWWSDELGIYKLSEISPAIISECRDKLAATELGSGKLRSPATVNRYLAVLSHAFTVAMKEWGWIEDNPLRRVSRLKEPQGRVRYLSDDERQSLFVACDKSRNQILLVIVTLAISSGMRFSEIMNLRWPDIDFDRSVLYLHKTKNNERRAVPLFGPASVALKERSKVRRIGSDLVFPNHKGDAPANIRSAWNHAVSAAGLEDFRFHDLRHSAASYLAMNGASPSEIAAVLGHKTLQMVKRYAHLSEQHTASVVASMNEKIFGNGKI